MDKTEEERTPAEVKEDASVLQKKQIQESMRLGRLQAREFAKTYNLPADSLAVRYAALEGKSRRVRQRFYKENDMYKTGIMRRLGQAVWG